MKMVWVTNPIAQKIIKVLIMIMLIMGSYVNYHYYSFNGVFSFVNYHFYAYHKMYDKL